MIKKLLIGLVLSIAILVGIMVHKLRRINQEAKDDRNASIIRLHDGETGRFFCSGTVISDNLALTAGHCVIRDFLGMSMLLSRVEIKNSKNEYTGVFATVANAEGRSDQALLYGDFKNFKHRKIITNPVEVLAIFTNPSAKIVMCGFPYGGRLYCNNFKYIAPFLFQIKGQGFLYPGMSGGPVIDLETGNVIAVNTAMMEEFVILSPTVETFNLLNVSEDK